jgi:hypothetical protein
MTLLRRALVPLMICTLVLIASATGAHAANPTPYYVWNDYGYCTGTAAGEITWYNRTARVSGYVDAAPLNDTRCQDNSTTTVFFEAYAGTRKIEVQTRTVRHRIGEGHRVYEFDIGDTNLVGGINRIKITLCDYYFDFSMTCGDPLHVYRP